MTDLWQGALVDCSIWHGRAGNTANAFRYAATYAALPLDAFEAGQLALRPDAGGLWQVRRRDYGRRDGTSLADFIRAELAPAGLVHAEVTLVTLPCSALYGFNPVSFWLARSEGGLRAVIAEVSNTFGERHLYLVRHRDNRAIDASDRIEGEKLFHVSPFLPREGKYVFRFDAAPGRFGAWVDWIGATGELRLRTSLTGPARPLNAQSLRRAMWRRPLQAQKVMALIHWQAAKLFLRGARYHSKPKQLARTRSEANDR